MEWNCQNGWGKQGEIDLNLGQKIDYHFEIINKLDINYMLLK